MSEKFDIQINLNGWLIPFSIENKGSGIFKINFENLTLGFLKANNSNRWTYLQNSIAGEGLLNKRTTDKICQAIKYY